jgi:hypothetical protein
MSELYLMRSPVFWPCSFAIVMMQKKAYYFKWGCQVGSDADVLLDQRLFREVVAQTRLLVSTWQSACASRIAAVFSASGEFLHPCVMSMSFLSDSWLMEVGVLCRAWVMIGRLGLHLRLLYSIRRPARPHGSFPSVSQPLQPK